MRLDVGDGGQESCIGHPIDGGCDPLDVRADVRRQVATEIGRPVDQPVDRSVSRTSLAADIMSRPA
jgi:hypothetical protein